MLQALQLLKRLARCNPPFPPTYLFYLNESSVLCTAEGRKHTIMKAQKPHVQILCDHVRSVDMAKDVCTRQSSIWAQADNVGKWLYNVYSLHALRNAV